MRIVRLFLGIALASVGFSSHALAMGSGPHPTVPYGLPLHPAHSATNTSHPSLFLICGIIALTAVFVLTALMTYAETRQRKPGF